MTEPDDRLAIAIAAVKAAWPHVASFMGSVLALAFIGELTFRGRLVAVATGFFAATFLGPVANAAATHFAPFLPAQIVAPGLNFLLALCAMAVIPPGLKAIQARAGDPAWVDALLKKVPQ